MLPLPRGLRGPASLTPPPSSWLLPFRPGPLCYLFSSGMWSAIICRGSRHCSAQPWRSLSLSVSTFRKPLGMRLQSTGRRVWTSSRGGHCGTGFVSSLLKMAADRGMAFWGKAERGQTHATQRCPVTGQATRPPISDSELYIKERQTHPGTSEGSPSANKDLT